MRLTVLIATLLTLLPQVTLAQEDPISEESDGDARLLFELGNRLYSRGEFEQAAESFQRAYEASRRPELLYNVYIAHRDAGNPAAAAGALRQYLADTPADQLAEQPAVLERRLASLERQAEAQSAGQIDSSGSETQSTEEPDGEVTTEEGRTEPELIEVEDPEPPPATDSGSRTPVGAITLVGLGGAAIIGGVITGIMTRSRQSNLEDNCDPAGTDGVRLCNGDIAGDIDSGKTLALTTDILLFGGAALAVGGALWWIFGGSDSDTTASAACSGDGCTMQVQGQF